MRVLVFTNMYPAADAPHYGSFVRDEAEALRSAGVEVDVLVIDARHNKLDYFSGARRFFAALRARSYDIIHVHHSFCGVIATMQRKVPVVWTFHEGAIAAGMTTRIDHRPGKRLAYSRSLKTLVAQRVDAVIAVSEPVRALLGRDGAVVIPSGVDLERFVPMDRREAAGSLGLPTNHRYILFPSSPSRPEKRYHLAARAVEHLKEIAPEAADVALLALDKVPHDVVPRFMNAAELLLMTSALEASPVSVREALACNVPVVSTAVGDVPEAVAGIDGCAITGDDPRRIAVVLRDVLARGNRVDSRARMQEHSLEIQAKRVKAVYENMLARRSHAPDSGRAGEVAFVRHCYYYPYEGKVKREADAIMSLGYQARVICLRDRGETFRDTVDGVEIYRLPLRHRRGKILRYLYEYNAFFLMASCMLAWMRIRYRLRAVQVHTMPDYLVFCALFPKLTGARVMLHLHEPMPELFGAIFKRRYTGAFVRMVKAAQRASIAFATRATTVTREMKDTFAKHGSRVDKVTVVLNVPDDRLLQLGRYSEIRERVAQIKDEERKRGVYRIFTHGAVEERYGLDVIVRAVAELREHIPGIQFRFTGRGDAIEDVLALSRELGVEEHVNHLGFVPFERMIEEILAADACVVSMRKNAYSDLVHTNKMFEYVALHRPVIATRLDSTLSYFPDDCFLYYDSEDPAELAGRVRFAHANPEQLKTRVALAFARYETYRWDHERAKYLGVYEEMLGGAPRLRVEPAPTDTRQPAGPHSPRRARPATGA